MAAVAIGLACLAAPCRAQRQPRVAEVQVAPAEAQVDIGARQPYVATAFDASGNPLVAAEFRWSSSDPRVATVDTTGFVTAVGMGRCWITAVTGGGDTEKAGRAALAVLGPGGEVPPPLQVEAQPPAAPAAAARSTGQAALAHQPEGTGTPESLLIAPRRVTLAPRASHQLQYRTVRADGQNGDRVPVIFWADPAAAPLFRVDSVGLITARGDTGRGVVVAWAPASRQLLPVAIAVEIQPGAAAVAESLPPTPGFLTVGATPFATVSVDGVALGDTPLVRRVMAPGEHKVRLVRDGYRSDEFKVTIESGKDTRVNRTLVREGSPQ
jgi:hypothetical protein